MHILVIPSWYKTDKNPIYGSFFEEQARGLQKKGCKVGLFHVGFKSFFHKGLLVNKEYVDNNLPTYYYEFKAIAPRLRKLNYNVLCYKAYLKFIKYVKLHGKPDVIHAHSVFFGGIVAQYISKKTGIPYVITEHLTNFITGGITNKTDLFFTNKVFNNSHTNIVVSTTFKKELVQKLDLNAKKVIVINNMVSPMFFQDFKEREIESQEEIVFFSNSFITERKNQKLLIDAFVIFNKYYPNAKLLIGGDITADYEIPLKNRLLEYSKSFNLNIQFLGLLSRHQVKQYLQMCHVFLLASAYETFGVVLIEALASGRPIISTNSKGPEDIIDGKNGCLVQIHEAQYFAEAMISVIENYSTYNQKVISEKCESKFGDNAIINQIMAVYKNALS
jgi:glycosyltransferase involved in cell wall biosynthesis